MFPTALSACLMPDHLHVIVEARSAAEAQRALAYALRAFARVTGMRGLWEPVPEPSIIPDRKHLLRQVRYVHLNPCRGGLAADPMMYPWSTHRGILGAEAAPWIDARRLAHAVGKPARGFADWLHGYVSADPSVAVSGAPPPRVAAIPGMFAASVSAMRAAVLAAGPLADEQALRAGFIALCRAHGFRNVAWLGRVLRITASRARRLAKRRDGGLFRAALLCLGDERLRLHTGFDRPGVVSLASRPPEQRDGRSAAARDDAEGAH